MGYCEFLTGLFEEGRVVVPEFSPLTEEQVVAGDDLIARYERVYQLELPGPAPQFIPSAARWAGTSFFRACQFAVFRDIGRETVDQQLGVPYGESVSPEVHYTVDLIFRYLPDMTRFASSASGRDPLLEHLYRWGHHWPLSSVGMARIENVDITGFSQHGSLLRLYADRIVATGDKTRLLHEEVRDVVRSGLGLFPELAEGITAALTEYDNPTENKDQEATR